MHLCHYPILYQLIDLSIFQSNQRKLSYKSASSQQCTSPTLQNRQEWSLAPLITNFNNGVFIHLACRFKSLLLLKHSWGLFVEIHGGSECEESIGSMAKKTSKSTADGTLHRVLPCRSSWVGKGQDHLQAYPFMGTSPDLCRDVIHQQTGKMLFTIRIFFLLENQRPWLISFT